MVVSIASQKGGTGKTSTSISLAAGLARRGQRVLLIDIDSPDLNPASLPTATGNRSLPTGDSRPACHARPRAR